MADQQADSDQGFSDWRHEGVGIALADENIITALIDAAKVCSLGQMSGALHQVGGRYRRNM